MQRRLLISILAFFLTLLPALSQAQAFRILWLDASVNESKANADDRKKMVRFLDQYDGGQTYDVAFQYTRRGGEFAKHMQSNRYDMIVVDATNFSKVFNRADLDAFRKFYASSGKALMLDGSLWIRNTRYHKRSRFPGDNQALAGLLVNQIDAMQQAGGGLLIGSDHDQYQVTANQVLNAVVPGAKFSGLTVPSTDGEFIGDLLVAGKVAIKPADILRHWESVPNQGQAPTGQYTDFTGASITLHSLVEISDKPGGKRRRTYVSFTEKPEGGRHAVDSEKAPEAVEDNMPTRKSVIQ